ASAKILAMLPNAAKLFRQQVADGLDGDPRASFKARVFLREWFGGQIRLVPDENGGLVAHWNQCVAALLRGVGSDGSGGRLTNYNEGIGGASAACAIVTRRSGQLI